MAHINYTKKIVSNASKLLIYSVLAAILAYIVRIVMARSLSPSEFGLFYAVFAFVAFFLSFTDLCLPFSSL